MKEIPKILQENGIQCLTSFWKVLKLYSNMTFCNINQTQAKICKVKIWDVNIDFVKQPEVYGCPLPCTSQSFNPKLNTFYDKETNEFLMIFVYFTTTTVEKKEEYFLYDLMNLTSALGGTMGLLLGYSLLSILLSLIKFLERCVLESILARKSKVKKISIDSTKVSNGQKK